MNLDGTLKGSLKGKHFTAAFDGDRIVLDMDVNMLDPLQEIFLPHFKLGMKFPYRDLIMLFDIQILMNGKPVAKLGKNAKPDLITKVIGLDWLEVQASQLISEFMGALSKQTKTG